MMTGELLYTEDEISTAARLVYGFLAHAQVIGLTGSLGAGKTTLIQAVLEQCGVHEIVQSPTFTYLSIYTGYDERRYYHFDLYRMKSLQDFIDAGFSEYLFEPQSYAFIEWPEIIQPLLKEKTCYLSLDYVSSVQRRMRYECL